MGSGLPGSECNLQIQPRQPQVAPAFHSFWRAPERSRRSRRPHVSASKTPTANALARASALPHGGGLTHGRVSGSALAERGAKLQLSAKRLIATRVPCRDPLGLKARRSVGSRGWFAGKDLANRPPTRWLAEWGVWLEQSVWSRFQA